MICQICNLCDLKLFIENYLFLKKIISVYFCSLSASGIDQNLLAFPRRSWRGCQNCILCAHRKFFLEKNNFSKKICFLLVWDMGQGTMAFCQFFPAVLSKRIFTCPYDHFKKFSFPKTYKISFDLVTLDKNTHQPFVIRNFAGFSKLHFHVSTGTYGGKWVRKNVCPFDNTFPAG